MKTNINKILIFSLTFILLIYLRLYLSIFGFGRTIKFLKKGRSNILCINKITYVIRSIEILSLKIPNITCLIRAATLKVFFNNTSSLKVIIGINVDKNQFFESHAWATFEDRIILNNDLKIEKYKIIYRI